MASTAERWMISTLLALSNDLNRLWHFPSCFVSLVLLKLVSLEYQNLVMMIGGVRCLETELRDHGTLRSSTAST